MIEPACLILSPPEAFPTQVLIHGQTEIQAMGRGHVKGRASAIGAGEVRGEHRSPRQAL